MTHLRGAIGSQQFVSPRPVKNFNTVPDTNMEEILDTANDSEE